MKRLMRAATLATTAFAAVALGACAGMAPTAYQPATERTFGYSDQRIEGNRFRVMFEGNSATSRGLVEDGLLLRAAELALANGDDWFRVVTRATDPHVSRSALPNPAFEPSFAVWRSWHPRFGWVVHGSPYGWGRSGWGWGGSLGWRGGYDVVESTRFQASAEIVTGRGPRPQGDADVFDAREVQANLSARLPRPMAAGATRG